VLFRSLPERTSNAAILGLASTLPIEAEIDKKTLSFYRNMMEDKSSAEYNIVLRQLGTKTNQSASWVIHVEKILQKYSLPNAFSILSNTPPKTTWKAKTNNVISTHWTKKLGEEAKEQNSSRFLSSTTLSPVTPTLVWSSANSNLLDSHKAQTKARIMCGVYRLQAHEALFTKRNKYPESPICKLCKEEPEDRAHFILCCPELSHARKELAKMQRTLQGHNLASIWENKETLITCILDSSHQSLNFPEQLQNILESQARNLLFSLHAQRCRALGLSSSSPRAAQRGQLVATRSNPCPRRAVLRVDTRRNLHMR
jgi:hypothetical protein